MIYRTYLGLDLGVEEIRGVALRRRRGGATLQSGRTLPVAESVLRPSAREPNVLDETQFTETVRDVLAPLADGEERVALSLPQASGGFLLTEVETIFRSRAEGEEILRWQLKGRLAVDPNRLRLDYQALRRTETGRQLLAVSWIAEEVAAQYEQLLERAGYGAALIDLHPLNVYNFYRSRLDLGEDFVLVGVERKNFFLIAFQGSIPVYFRSRELSGNPEGLFRDLSQTLAGSQEELPVLRRGTIYLNCTLQQDAAWAEAVQGAFDREVLGLDPHLERLATGRVDLEVWEARRLTAAIGAAERML